MVSRTDIDKADLCNFTPIYVQARGFKVKKIWECEWALTKRDRPDIRRFLKQQISIPELPVGDRYPMPLQYNTEDLCHLVEDGHLFGIVECDIELPEDLHYRFDKFPPIFANRLISRTDIGPHMRQFAEANGLMKTPRRALVSLHKADRIMLTTPLLKWYLRNGLRVTRIYQCLQFKPKRWVKHVADAIIKARRAADADPSLAIIAEMEKLIGNALYGKTATDKTRHNKVRFYTDQDVHVALNDPLYRACDQLKPGYYEVQSAKRQIRFDLPNVMAYFVYAYAKLSMLEYVYDFLDKFIDQRRYQFLQMDTVSLSLYSQVCMSDDASTFFVCRTRFTWQCRRNRCEKWYARTCLIYLTLRHQTTKRCQTNIQNAFVNLD